MIKRSAASIVVCLGIAASAYYFYDTLVLLLIPSPFAAVIYALVALAVWRLAPPPRRPNAVRQSVAVAALIASISSFTAAMLWAQSGPSEDASYEAPLVTFALVFASTTGVLALCVAVLTLSLTTRTQSPPAIAEEPG